MKIKPGWLMRLYPQTWRARYGEEFLALLEQCSLSAGVIADVALGALDARLHSDVVTGRMVPLMNRLRTSEITVFCAYIGFVVAGLGFGKLVEYDDFQELLHSNTGVAVSYWTLYGGAFTALLAVLVGGLPIAYAAARYLIAAKRWRLLSLFAVPPVSFVLWVGYILIAEAVNPHPGPIVEKPLLTRIVILGPFGGLFLLGAIASPAAISLIVRRSQISERFFRFARIPTLITTLAMVVMFLATLAYGVAASAADPQLFAENQGVLATNTTVSLVIILVMMGLATVVASVALIRGFRQRPGDSTLVPAAAEAAGW